MLFSGVYIFRIFYIPPPLKFDHFFPNLEFSKIVIWGGVQGGLPPLQKIFDPSRYIFRALFKIFPKIGNIYDNFAFWGKICTQALFKHFPLVLRFSPFSFNFFFFPFFPPNMNFLFPPPPHRIFWNIYTPALTFTFDLRVNMWYEMLFCHKTRIWKHSCKIFASFKLLRGVRKYRRTYRQTKWF